MTIYRMINLRYLFYIFAALFLICHDISAKHRNMDDIYRKAINFKEAGITDSAKTYYSMIYHSYNNEMDDYAKHLCAIAYLETARMYYYENDFPESLDLYLRGLKIIERCEDKSRIAEFYIGMADVYWLNQDLESAAMCYEKGYDLSITMKDTASLLNISNMLTGVYCYLHEHNKTEKYIKTANSINKDTIQQQYLNMLHHGIMNVNENRFDNAAQLFRASAILAKGNNMHPKYECSSYEELYKMYILNNNHDSAKHYLMKSYEILKRHPMVNMLPLCLKTMSEIYLSEGDYKAAYETAYKYSQLLDSTFRQREINKLRNTHVMYEAEKTGNEIASLRKQKAESENTIKTQWGVITGMICGILAILVFAIYVYRKKQELHQLYKKIYNAYKDTINSEQYNKELRVAYEKKIRQLEDDAKKRMSDKTDETETPYTKHKYSSSKLRLHQKDILVENIKKVMDNNIKEYCSSDFSLDRLAELVNSNSTYVSQVINEVFHKSFVSLVNEYRIKEACRMLNDTATYGHYTLKAISEIIGYKSQTTFIKTFKEITGMTPSIYMKIAKEEI